MNVPDITFVIILSVQGRLMTSISGWDGEDATEPHFVFYAILPVMECPPSRPICALSSDEQTLPVLVCGESC